MKRRSISVLFCAVVVMFLVLPVSGAQTSTEQQTAMEISELINDYRAESGKYEYVYNSTLASVAQAHTDYQVSINLSTHEGEGGSTSKQRVSASGYGEGKVIFVDEMIYNGQSATPQAAVDWWKNSPIHNAIMLSDQYHEIGVGVRITEERKYYTVNVAMIQGVTAPGVGSVPVEPPMQAITPVVVAPALQDGSIVHIVEAGQTLQQIAEAYQVTVDLLYSNNALTASSTLNAGQSITVRLADTTVAAPPEADQPAPEDAITTAIQPTVQIASPVAVEPAVPTGYTLIPNLLLTVLVVVAVVASAGVTFFAYLRLSESGRRRR